MDTPAPTPFELFKWTVLLDLWDYRNLWEPLYHLRGVGNIEGEDVLRGVGDIESQSETEKQLWAERAIRELHAAGLLYFFQVAEEVNESADDPGQRLSDTDIDAALGRGWFRDSARAARDPEIWMGPTPEGEAAMHGAPAALRKVYGI